MDIFGLTSGVSYGYTINLSAQASGTLIYNITGRGTHPFDAPATTNAAGSSNLRLNSYINMGANTVLRFDKNGGWGNSGTGNPVVTDQTAGLIYAFITMEGNAVIDARDARNPLTVSGTSTSSTGTFNPGGNVNSQGTLAIGGLNMSKDAVVYLNYGKSNLGASVLANMEENWAGLVHKEDWSVADFNVALTKSGTLPEGVTLAILEKNSAMQNTEKWGVGITRVTGTVWHPGGAMNIRSSGNNTNGYVVDGLHVGPINGQQSGAWIGGKGEIRGLVIPRKGSYVTGGDRGKAGTLTITGTLDISQGTATDPAGGSISIDLVKLDEVDKIVVNGSLVVSSTSGRGFLTVGRGDEFPLAPGVFRVIEVNGGGILGAFPEANVSLPQSQGLRASYAMGPDWLDIIFTQLAFADNPDLAGNYHTMAVLIDNGVGGYMPNEFFDTLNRQPSLDHFKRVNYQISPMAYHPWFPSAVLRTNSMVQAVENRLLQDAGFGRAPRSVQTYLQGWRQESSRDRDALVTYSNHDTHATLIGADYALSKNTVAGLWLAHESTEYDLDDDGGASTGKSRTLGLYARHNRGNWQLNALALHNLADDDYTTKRNIARTQMGHWAESKTKGSRLGAALSVAYTCNHPWAEITPVAGLQWLRWTADAFTETGFTEENMNLHVKAQDQTSLQARLGLRLSRAFEGKHGSIRPYLHLAYVHEFENGSRWLETHNTYGSGLDHRFEVPGIETNGMRIDAGVEWQLSKYWRIDAHYTAQYNGASDESLGVRLGVSFTF